MEIQEQSHSLEEIDELYGGRWVLVKVTALNRLHAPERGEVVAVGRKKALEFVRQLQEPGQEPEGPYYHFLAGNTIRTPDAMEAAVTSLLRESSAQPN